MSVSSGICKLFLELSDFHLLHLNTAASGSLIGVSGFKEKTLDGVFLFLS